MQIWTVYDLLQKTSGSEDKTYPENVVDKTQKNKRKRFSIFQSAV